LAYLGLGGGLGEMTDHRCLLSKKKSAKGKEANEKEKKAHPAPLSTPNDQSEWEWRHS